MKSQLSIFTILTILLSGTTLNVAQVPRPETTQSFLAEMPAPDRILREIQGTDPADTAARQMGAYKQLRKIIEDLAWNLDHRYETRLTPAETQIRNAYEEAYARVWRAGPDKSADNMHGLDRDLRFREEILNKFFSTNFRARFKQSFVDEDNRRKAKAQAEVEQMNQIKSQARAANAGTTDPGTLQARRCVESGRDAVRCTAEAIGQEFKIGIIDPILGESGLKAGLRMNGVFPGRGFGVVFAHAMGEYSVSVKCADLVPEGHPYVVELKNNQVVIRIANNPESFSLIMTPNGSLVGQSSVLFNGQVIAGYARQWVETRRVSDNSVVPGSGHYENVPIYKPKSARCTPGTLTPTQSKPVADDTGIFSTLTALMGTDNDTTPGLRLVGIFDGGQGVNLEFHPDSGTIGCRESAVAHKYSIGLKGTDLLINLKDPDASVFTYLPDGTIRGPGSLTVNGRKAVGGEGPASTNGINYIPWSDTCTFGALQPLKLGVRLDLSPFGLAPPPKQSGGPANAVLMISSGFPENGPAPGLRGRGIFLLTDSFESILWDAGYGSSPVKNMPAIAVWGRTCEVDQNSCVQALREAAKHKAGSILLDNMGQGSFPAVPPGTYYILTQTVFNNRHYLWNYRIDLQPGQNSLKLTDANATLK